MLTYEEERKRLSHVASAILSAVLALTPGETWTDDTSDGVYHRRSLKSSAGYSLSVSIEGRQERIIVKGHVNDLTNSMPWGVTLPRITVALSRTGPEIAREIQRRLLPMLRDVYAASLERRAMHQEVEARVMSTVDAIRAYFDYVRTDNAHKLSRSEPDCDAEVLSDSVKLTLRVSPDVAVRVMQLVTEAKGGPAE